MTEFFSETCEYPTWREDDEKHEGYVAQCGKPARIWNDLVSKLDVDETGLRRIGSALLQPYCRDCHELILEEFDETWCQARLKPIIPSDKVWEFCERPAKVWSDLKSKKYGSDLTPYCKSCHKIQLEHLKSTCQKCFLERTECTCG